MNPFSLFNGKKEILLDERLDAWIIRGETEAGNAGEKAFASPAENGSESRRLSCAAFYSGSDFPVAIISFPSRFPEGAIERAKRMFAVDSGFLRHLVFETTLKNLEGLMRYDPRLSCVAAVSGLKVFSTPSLFEALSDFFSNRKKLDAMTRNVPENINADEDGEFGIEGYAPCSAAWFFIPPTVKPGKSTGDIRIHSFVKGNSKLGGETILAGSLEISPGTGSLPIRYLFEIPSRAQSEEAARASFGHFIDGCLKDFISGLSSFWRLFFEGTEVSATGAAGFKAMGHFKGSIVFAGAEIRFSAEIPQASVKVLAASAARLGIRISDAPTDFPALCSLFSHAFASLQPETILNYKLFPFLNRIPGALPTPLVPLLNLLGFQDRTIIIQNGLLGSLGAKELPFLFLDGNGKKTFVRTVPALDTDITYALTEANVEDFTWSLRFPPEPPPSRIETETAAARAILAALRKGGLDVSDVTRKIIERTLEKPLDDLDELVFKNLAKADLWFPVIKGLSKEMKMYVLAQVSDREMASALLGEEEKEAALKPFLPKSRGRAIDEELAALKTRLKEGTIPRASISGLKREAAEKMSLAVKKRKDETEKAGKARARR